MLTFAEEKKKCFSNFSCWDIWISLITHCIIFSADTKKSFIKEDAVGGGGGGVVILGFKISR